MDDLRIAIPKGRNLKPSVELLNYIGIDFRELLTPSRKLLIKGANSNVEAVIVRDADIPTYVEQGAADIGIAGSDQLAEQRKDLYEPVDLKFGYCKMVVAAPKEFLRANQAKEFSHLKIATKFPTITEEYFLKRGIEIEVIKLYGSIELAPLTDLSEQIVDLVSTGETLRENGLVAIEDIMDVTARLVVNRASMRVKAKTIKRIINLIRDAISQMDLAEH